MPVFTNLHITVLQNYGVGTATVPSIMESLSIVKNAAYVNVLFPGTSNNVLSA